MAACIAATRNAQQASPRAHVDARLEDSAPQRLQGSPQIDQIDEQINVIDEVLQGMPPAYGQLFSKHLVTAEVLTALNETDLSRIGVELVGHQKIILNRIRQLAVVRIRQLRQASEPVVRPPNSQRKGTLDLLWKGFVTGHFIRVGGMTKQEAFDLNTQLSTISALVWFASVTWVIGNDEVYEFVRVYAPRSSSGPLPGIEGSAATKDAHDWVFWPSYFVFQCSVVSSAISTFMGVHNNMLLLQVRCRQSCARRLASTRVAESQSARRVRRVCVCRSRMRTCRTTWIATGCARSRCFSARDSCRTQRP
jgi:hypothetical protein